MITTKVIFPKHRGLMTTLSSIIRGRCHSTIYDRSSFCRASRFAQKKEEQKREREGKEKENKTEKKIEYAGWQKDRDERPE